MLTGVFVDNTPLIKIVVGWGKSVQSPIEIPVARALAVMEGMQRKIQVLISNSMPLAGISFLTKFGYKAVV